MKSSMWRERIAIFSVTVRQTFAGVIAALIGWWLILGADPRQLGESRHLIAIVVSGIWLVSIGIVLNLTSRYGSKYPWKWARAGQLGAVVGLLQLGLAQPSSLHRVTVTGIGIVAVVVCIGSWWRIVANIKQFRAMDAIATYGVMSTALLLSGAYHAQTIKLNVTIEGSTPMAHYQVRGWFGTVALEDRNLPGITSCKLASAIDYGTGCVLIGERGNELFVRGGLQNWTVAGKAYRDLDEAIERLESFHAEETRFWVFGIYAFGAIATFSVGALRDPFSYGNTLVQPGDLATHVEGDFGREHF